MTHEMREYAGGIRGRLRLSAWYHVEPDIVDFMRDFTAANPLVEVSIQELPARRPSPHSEPGTSTWRRSSSSPSSTSTISNGSLSATGACGPGRPGRTTRWPAKTRLNLADLSDMPFVVTRPGTGLRRLFDHVFAGAERAAAHRDRDQ